MRSHAPIFAPGDAPDDAPSKNVFCKVGNDVKIKQAQARRRNPDVKEVSERYGDLILADHIVRNKTAKGSREEPAGLLVKDIGTGWR